MRFLKFLLGFQFTIYLVFSTIFVKYIWEFGLANNLSLLILFIYFVVSTAYIDIIIELIVIIYKDKIEIEE